MLSLDAESFLEVLCVQKLIHEGMIGGDLSFDIRFEHVYLNSVGFGQAAHRLLEQIDVVLRCLPRFFKRIDHQSTNGFQEFVFGFHLNLHSQENIYVNGAGSRLLV